MVIIIIIIIIIIAIPLHLLKLLYSHTRKNLSMKL